MLRAPLVSFKDGWVVGNFDPSLYRTARCELCVRTHPTGQVWPMHYQEHATEINVLVGGRLRIKHYNGTPDDVLYGGEVFLFPPGKDHASQPIFEKPCTVVTLKLPSMPTDKRVIP